MEDPKSPPRRRTEFDDALKGYYQDHDELSPEESEDYRSLTAESVGSLILGFLSVLTFVSVVFIVFPIMGIVLGLLAIRKILRASEVLSGLGISTAGVALCLLFSVLGVGYQIYLYSFEIPPGYEPIKFTDLVADPVTGQLPEQALLLAVRRDSGGRLEPLVERFDEEGRQIMPPPVFIEGYMYPTRQVSDIDVFTLVPSIEQERFGAVTPNPTEMIGVKLLYSRIPYRTSTIRVGGYLFVDENYTQETPPYRLEADTVR